MNSENLQTIGKSFVVKLYRTLQNRTFKEIIDWTEDGFSVVIKNIPLMISILLPSVYKHQNYSSFVRQLNTYGFIKISHLEGEHIYRNQHFHSNEKPDYSMLQRKNGQKNILSKGQQSQNNNIKVLNLKVQKLESKIQKIHEQFDSKMACKLAQFEKKFCQLQSKLNYQDDLIDRLIKDNCNQRSTGDPWAQNLFSIENIQNNSPQIQPQTRSYLLKQKSQYKQCQYLQSGDFLIKEGIDLEFKQL